ncbi:MAG: type I CRISPR-associated protein Cas7 [Verrucomicrobiia bacterium]
MSKDQDTNLVPRITGLLILEVRKSNPNGDPERESSPRQRPDAKGEISPVSVKRKLRDLVLEKEGVVWQEIKRILEIPNDDRFQILESRGRKRDEIKKQMEPKDGKLGQAFIDAYWDGRLFGNTFLEEGGSDTIRSGVAHFGVGVSIAPIEIEFSTWTSKSGVEAGKDRGMAPMAFRVVKHGVYAIPFFVNPNLAHKTGCAKLDVDLMLHLLKHTYADTRSVVRTMVEVVHAHTLTHNSRAGSVSDFAFIDALMPKKKANPDKPSESLSDYVIPQWTGDVEKKPIRESVATKFTDCGKYKDYAL